MDQAQKGLDGLQRTSSSLEATFAKLVGALSLGVVVRDFIQTNEEFQRLHVSLVTVTGDIDAADRAFNVLQDFAKRTPYQLSELTQAFVDLRVRGMDASVTSMASYGNMASAFGRSLNDLIRAIGGVAMGETEAIKSFGVQAAASGERIALTFRGQTQVVARSVADVEAYFKRLSDANFAGGMERQSKTLGGVLSNLRDQIQSTFYSIGNGGVADSVTRSIQGLTDVIAKATPAMVSFAGASVKALTSVITWVDTYKKELGLAALALVSMSAASALVNSATIAGGIAFAAQISRTVALTYAVNAYSISATAATLAQSAWNAVSLTGVAAFGVLAAAIAAIYLATGNLRKEIERLNKEVANSQPFHDRAKMHQDFADGTRNVEDSIKTLRAALAGDRNAKLALDDPEIAAYREQARKNGTEAFERQIDLRIKARQEEKALRAQLDAQNAALKDQEELAKRIKDERKAFLRTLREEVDTFGMGATEKLQYKATRLGAAGSTEFKDLMEMRRIRQDDIKAAQREVDLIQERRQAQAIAFDENQRLLESEADHWDRLIHAAYPYIDQARDIYEAQGLVNEAFDRGLLPLGLYERRMGDLRAQEMKLRAESGDTWAIIGTVVLENTNKASNALADWMDGIDGTARTWKSLGDTVRNVIADMLRQMERAIIQQNIMRVAFNWISTGLSAYGSSAGTTGGTTGTSAGSGIGNMGSGMGSMSYGMAAASSGKGGTNVGSIVVNVSTSGETTTEGGNGQWKTVAGMIGAKVREVLVDESRPGGLLARA